MTDNRTLILKDSSTTKEALELLQQNGNGFLAVVDEEMYLLGVITDGDIRVALLEDRKSTRLNSSHSQQSRMPSSA